MHDALQHRNERGVASTSRADIVRRELRRMPESCRWHTCDTLARASRQPQRIPIACSRAARSPCTSTSTLAAAAACVLRESQLGPARWQCPWRFAVAQSTSSGTFYPLPYVQAASAGSSALALGLEAAVSAVEEADDRPQIASHLSSFVRCGREYRHCALAPRTGAGRKSHGSA